MWFLLPVNAHWKASHALGLHILFFSQMDIFSTSFLYIMPVENYMLHPVYDIRIWQVSLYLSYDNN